MCTALYAMAALSSNIFCYFFLQQPQHPDNMIGFALTLSHNAILGFQVFTFQYCCILLDFIYRVSCSSHLLGTCIYSAPFILRPPMGLRKCGPMQVVLK